MTLELQILKRFFSGCWTMLDDLGRATEESLFHIIWKLPWSSVHNDA